MRRVAGDNVHVIEQDDRTLRLCVVCGTTAHRSARPGWYSKTWFSIPSWSRIFLKNCARLHLVAGRIGCIDAEVLLHPIHGEVGVLLHTVGRDTCRRPAGLGGAGLRAAGRS